MKKVVIFLFAGLILLQGCANKQALLKKRYPNPTYRQLLEIHEQWLNQIKSFSGKGRITIDSPQFSGNFIADVFATGKDSLLVVVKGLFGSNVGKVFIGHQRFIFYNQYENQFITGNKSDFDSTNFLQFPLSLSELQQVFLARDKFNVLKKKSFETRPEGYYLVAENGRFNYHIWFDLNTLLIKRIEYLDGEEMLFFKEYRQFVENSGILFPRVINFVRPNQHQGMSIIFKRIEINKPIDKQVFQIEVNETAKQLIMPQSNS